MYVCIHMYTYVCICVHMYTINILKTIATLDTNTRIYMYTYIYIYISQIYEDASSIA